ncbi:MAG: hypothetical protein ACU85U_12665 [Gammaproteobacteria bacterium]
MRRANRRGIFNGSQYGIQVDRNAEDDIGITPGACCRCAEPPERGRESHDAYKGLEFSAGQLVPGDTNDDLVAWSGINGGPVVVYNDEKPLERWVNILYLLERLAAQPARVPDDPEQRVQVFGMSHELCGEMGLGWKRRRLMFAPMIESGNATDGIALMGGKYNYNTADSERAGARIVATLQMLHRQLERQQQAGSEYFIGGAPGAVNFYWTAFSNLIEIISRDKIPLPEEFRPLFHQGNPAVAAAFTPLLRAHRERFFDTVSNHQWNFDAPYWQR